MKKIFNSRALLFGIIANGICFNSFGQCFNLTNAQNFTFAGNQYVLVKEPMTWIQAADCAASLSGHLVHITSAEEQTAVYNAITESEIPLNYNNVATGGGISYIWIGASDINEEGTWKWNGDNKNTGNVFWTGQGAAGNGEGTAAGYVNWGGSDAGEIKEPDNYLGGQDAAAIALSGWPAGTTNLGKAGEWNDIDATNELYFIIEFETATGLNEIKEYESLKVSPNPARHNLHLHSKNEIKSFKIVNMNGSIVLSEVVNLSNNVDVNTTKLIPGIYFVLMVDKNDIMQAVKFVKE